MGSTKRAVEESGTSVRPKFAAGYGGGTEAVLEVLEVLVFRDARRSIMLACN